MGFQLLAMDPAYFEMIAASDEDDARMHARTREDRESDFSPAVPSATPLAPIARVPHDQPGAHTSRRARPEISSEEAPATVARPGA